MGSTFLIAKRFSNLAINRERQVKSKRKKKREVGTANEKEGNENEIDLPVGRESHMDF